MLFKELLAESLLIENLGNLGNLGLGKMVNAFKQKYYHGNKRSEVSSSAIEPKFVRTYQGDGVGHDSTVEKLGSISSWNEFKRKAGDKVPVGAVLRVDGNAVVTLVLQGGFSVKDYRAGSIIGVAFDLKRVFNSLDPHDSDKLSDEMISSGLIVNSNTRDTSTRVETNRWDETRVRKYEGVATLTKNVVTFVNTLASVVNVEAELIMTGESDKQKRLDRLNNQPIDPKDIKLFSDDLRVRLAKYKATKLVNVEDVQQLVNVIFSNNGALKKINFQGRPYHLVPEAEYVQSPSKNASGGYSFFASNLFSGKEVSVRFTGDTSAHNFDSLYLTIKLVDGVIKPTKIRVGGVDHKL